MVHPIGLRCEDAHYHSPCVARFSDLKSDGRNEFVFTIPNGKPYDPTERWSCSGAGLRGCYPAHYPPQFRRPDRLRVCRYPDGARACGCSTRSNERLGEIHNKLRASKARSLSPRKLIRRGGRVAEGNGLLNRRRDKISTKGSNPSLSAIQTRHSAG